MMLTQRTRLVTGPTMVADSSLIAIDMKDIVSRVSSFDVDNSASALGLNNGNANNEHGLGTGHATDG